MTPLRQATEKARDPEVVARMLDRDAWDSFDYRQKQARACVDLGHEESATLWIKRAHDCVAPSLAKARAIIALSPDTLPLIEALEGAERALEAASNGVLVLHDWIAEETRQTERIRSASLLHHVVGEALDQIRRTLNHD